ncbi:MAG: VOC family protein [Hyphomicrobiaceae bacterium]|nr:VOC family protein [Hyphomicrobiaceae bacterium]
MLRYVTLGSNDLARSARFYDAALAPLGYCRLVTTDREIGYGLPGATAELWVLTPFNGAAATFGNGTDVAFDAPSHAAIDAFHAAALANGGSDEGAPGLRRHYTPTFYTAYVRDPDGNKLNAVFDAPV